MFLAWSCAEWKIKMRVGVGEGGAQHFTRKMQEDHLTIFRNYSHFICKNLCRFFFFNFCFFLLPSMAYSNARIAPAWTVCKIELSPCLDGLHLFQYLNLSGFPSSKLLISWSGYMMQLLIIFNQCMFLGIPVIPSTYVETQRSHPLPSHPIAKGQTI